MMLRWAVQPANQTTRVVVVEHRGARALVVAPDGRPIWRAVRAVVRTVPR